MSQKIFVRKDHTIIRIMHFLHRNCFKNVIFFCGKKFIKHHWLYAQCNLFAGKNSDTISLALLRLWVMVVMLSFEGSEVSSTESLSWLSSTIPSEVWAFFIPHVMEAAFLWIMITIPPEKPLPFELRLKWQVSNTNNLFKSVLIYNDLF